MKKAGDFEFCGDGRALAGRKKDADKAVDMVISAKNHHASAHGHVPVMLSEVLDVLQPRDNGIYVDGTFGGGGYSRALLEAANCTVIAIDRDPEAIQRGQLLQADFPDRLVLIEGRFSQMVSLLQPLEIEHVDGVTLDVGVSSFQIDDPARGFSFQADGPLDMRMEGAASDSLSAADVVNNLTQKDLASLIYIFGEEKQSRAIAKAIVDARLEQPLARTGELAALIESVVHQNPNKKNLHPATRTFQALRIYVNGELDELSEGLSAAETILATDGRMAIVSFHSLEDRIVKRFLRHRCGKTPQGSRHMPPDASSGNAPSFIEIKHRAQKPDEAETALNPRARSARLRAAQRTSAPAWPIEAGAMSFPTYAGGEVNL